MSTATATQPPPPRRPKAPAPPPKAEKKAERTPDERRKMVPLASIKTHPDLQMRDDAGSDDVIESYVELLRDEPDDFQFRDPIVLFKVKGELWLVEGHRRTAATALAPRDAILADIFYGTMEEASEYALFKANATHGTPYSLKENESRVKKIVARYPKKPDGEIAEEARVSRKLVGRVRKILTCAGGTSENVRVVKNRHGGTNTMNVSNIGKARRQKDVSEDGPAAPEPGDGSSQAWTEVPAGSVQDALSERTAAEFKELVNRTHALRRDIEALSRKPIGRELYKGMFNINSDLRSVATRIARYTPFKACPFRGCTKTCKACVGTGWVSEDVWNGIDKYTKEASE